MCCGNNGKWQWYMDYERPKFFRLLKNYIHKIIPVNNEQSQIHLGGESKISEVSNSGGDDVQNIKSGSTKN